MHLMSRKQRAAKLLNGDIGLTGLDALTEGEGGLEEALMDAIGKGESLIDPKELFKTAAAQSEISDEDAAYWNVEVVTAKTIQAQTAQPVVVPPQHDIFEYVNVEHEHAALQPPMLEPASAGVETHDALVKALENCGGQITSITINDCVSKQVMPAKVSTALTRAIPKKPKRRRLDLLAAPPNKPISPLAILAGKASSPTRPALSVSTVKSAAARELVQLALF